MTCFATVALLSTFKGTIRPTDVIKICKMTPTERLIAVSVKYPGTKKTIKEALDLYCWFLRKTGLSTAKLEEYFSSDKNRKTAFANARKFGDKIFNVLSEIDRRNDNIRFMVV